jgi:hypothetical protein
MHLNVSPVNAGDATHAATLSCTLHHPTQDTTECSNRRVHLRPLQCNTLCQLQSRLACPATAKSAAVSADALPTQIRPLSSSRPFNAMAGKHQQATMGLLGQMLKQYNGV